jgi:hypothetical protein
MPNPLGDNFAIVVLDKTVVQAEVDECTELIPEQYIDADAQILFYILL